MKNNDLFTCALVGGVAALGVWFIADRVLAAKLSAGGVSLVQQAENALREAARVEVPAQVRQALDQRLAEAGLDRTTGQRISRLLAYADTMGLIGLGGSGRRGVRGRA